MDTKSDSMKDDSITKGIKIRF